MKIHCEDRDMEGFRPLQALCICPMVPLFLKFYQSACRFLFLISQFTPLLFYRFLSKNLFLCFCKLLKTLDQFYERPVILMQVAIRILKKQRNILLFSELITSRLGSEVKNQDNSEGNTKSLHQRTVKRKSVPVNMLAK